MIYFIMLLVSLFASVIGAICGIGGGIVIKPVLDSMNLLSVSAISFLSGFTVLCMTMYNVSKTLWNREPIIPLRQGLPLSLGAAAGGIFGKISFSVLGTWFDSDKIPGTVQSSLLLVLTLGTFIYTVNKEKITTYKVKNIVTCLLVGAVLGYLSSFLGIGGGPFNLVVLSFFFSMKTKEAVQSSLLIILFSQITAVIQTGLSGEMPDVALWLMVTMGFMGVLGGIAGRKINKKISSKTVDRLFEMLLILIVGVCVLNCVKYYVV